jgi:DNA-binding NtrC family response regulator
VKPDPANADLGAETAEARTVLLVSADAGVRQRLAARLAELRWKVREANGGAQALLALEEQAAEAMLLDAWLPDLEVGEFREQATLLDPQMDVLSLEGAWCAAREDEADSHARSPRRNELLLALREAREDGADAGVRLIGSAAVRRADRDAYRVAADGSVTDGSLPPGKAMAELLLPELVGGSRAMREVARLVRLVAPRSTTVLIEGETGTGKELVARALHALSPRAAKPFVVLNCAAIPESLLEAELFGHTRGAFTGAVQSRMGKIEAADGGTLLLDEIGEMPLGMQAKMLRFLESGELQRVGENSVTRIDVRLIAATHQPLEERSAQGTFRLDLYHRLAVFPIELPPLRERMHDIPELACHFLEAIGRESPRQRLAPAALAKLQQHHWPGNVRELMHVLERATILAGANPEIGAADIRYRRAARS